MSWAPIIGRPFGIEVRLHATFLVLLAVLAILPLWHGAGVFAAGIELAFLLGLFSSVVLHELGHALMARRFGISTSAITLLPIGGVAQLRAGQMAPRVELLVALAGPVVNAVLAALLWGVTAVVPETSILGSLLGRLMVANVALGVFNLLPAFPMDGGRVLRALLSSRLGATRATTIAAGLGRVFAWIFGGAALVLGRPVLLLVALFLFFAARLEGRRAKQRERAEREGVPYRVAYVRRAPRL